MQDVNQDRHNIPSWWNNLFRNEQIICLREADSASRLYGKEFTFDKSSSIKLTIYQKLAHSNGNFLGSFLMYVIFITPVLLLPKLVV